MNFITKQHENDYYSLLKRMGAADNKDVYRQALAYLLTLDTVCSKHIEQIYDFEDCCIDPSALEQGWQTGTSQRTTRLAFNLFTGHTDWCPDGEAGLCSAAYIFCSEYAPYYWEAIKLRYPEQSLK